MQDKLLPLEPATISNALAHEIGLSEESEVYRFYAKERRKHCTTSEIMNLWLLVPYCYDCALNESWDGIVDPCIGPDDWAEDLRSHVGDAVVTQAEDNVRHLPDFGFSCKRCGTGIQPWNGDEMSVARVHVEERFAVPMETPGRQKPSRELARRIKRYYDCRCFGCARHESEGVLHIDHIFPQSKGGTAAFRNLQPLCERCGNEKGDSLPEEVDVCSTMFFGAPPSDSYEGLFW